MMRRGPIVPSSIALILTLFAGALHADFRDNFRQAVQAFERQEWREAARFLRLAVSERPRDEELRILVPGRGRLPYIPNTLLAIALMRLDDCRAAHPFFRAAEDHRVAANLAPNYHRQLLQGSEACAQQLTAATIQETRSELEAAGEVVDRLETLMSRADLQPYLEQQPELGRRVERAAEEVKNSLELLDRSVRGGMLAVLADLRRSASVAKDNAESLRDDVRSHLRSAVAPAVSEAEAAIAAADEASERLRPLRDDRESRAIWSANPHLGERARQATQQLDRAKSSLQAARGGDDPGPITGVIAAARQSTEALAGVGEEARRLVAAARAAARREAATTTPAATADREDPEPSISRPRDDTSAADTPTPEPAATTPSAAAAPPGTGTGPAAVPADLRAAAEAYFRGEYDVVLAALAAPAFAEARLQAQAHLFRAASALALYRLDGEREESQLAAARQDVERGLEADPGLVADPRYFPPAVIELYAAARR